MEASDPLAAPQETTDDPFAETPSDPLTDEGDLPPGVEPGSLGGENPTAEGEDEVAEPEPGEFMEDPEELPAEGDEEDYPPEAEADVAPVSEGDDIDETSDEEAGTTVEDSDPPSDDEPEADEPEADEPEAKPEAEAKPEVEDEPTAEDGRRGYVILKGSEQQGVWEEAFPRKGRSKKPATLQARNGSAALRAAYRKLTDDGEGDFVLVAVPAKLFNPKPVSGERMGGIAIKVG